MIIGAAPRRAGRAHKKAAERNSDMRNLGRGNPAASEAAFAPALASAAVAMEFAGRRFRSCAGVQHYLTV